MGKVKWLHVWPDICSSNDVSIEFQIKNKIVIAVVWKKTCWITTLFCTYHDSTVVLKCIKFSYDQMKNVKSKSLVSQIKIGSKVHWLVRCRANIHGGSKCNFKNIMPVNFFCPMLRSQTQLRENSLKRIGRFWSDFTWTHTIYPRYIPYTCISRVIVGFVLNYYCWYWKNSVTLPYWQQ